MLKKIRNALTYPGMIMRLSRSTESYYPEFKRKKVWTKRKELFQWMLRYGEVNEYYYLWGFDIVDKPQDWREYESLKEFMRMRARSNKSDQSVLLRDKYLFYKYMSAIGMPVPRVFGVIRNNVFYNEQLSIFRQDKLEGIKDYFCKAIDGQCGEHVKYIQNYQQLMDYVGEEGYVDSILQERITQHDTMKKLNPMAVNSIRIVTYLDRGKPMLFDSILRIGTSKSEERDNTSRGGIGIGIKQNGQLHEYGLQKPEYGGRIKQHPETGIIFSEFTIPFYKEAIDMCLEAHRFFYNIKSIGWDVAITCQGPVFIEGNDNWEMQTFQAIYGGQKKRWYKMCKENEHTFKL